MLDHVQHLAILAKLLEATEIVREVHPADQNSEKKMRKAIDILDNTIKQLRPKPD